MAERYFVLPLEVVERYAAHASRHEAATSAGRRTEQDQSPRVVVQVVTEVTARPSVQVRIAHVD